MTSSKTRTGLLALAAALPLSAGLVLAAGAAAPTQTPQVQTPQTQVPQRVQPAQTRQPGGTNYADVFLQKLAAQLGVSVERLKAAAVQAGSATVDQAVQAGDLSSDRAAALKQRLQNAPLNFGLGGRHGPGGPDHGGRGERGRRDGGPRGSGHPPTDSQGGQSADTTGS